MLQGILHEERSISVLLLVTVALGGWAAWMTGRALALAWRPVWLPLVAALPLAFAVRFIHFALFGGTLLSGRFYLVDLAVVAAAAALGHRVTRAGQMTRQYRWLYERTGPLSWREKPQA